MTTKRVEIEEQLQRQWMENEAVAELFGFEVGATFDSVYAKVSVIRLLFYVVSAVAAGKETSLDEWKEEVRRVAETTHYGTESWWVETVKAWQEGDELEEVDGRMGYAVVDESKKVVTAVSIGTAWRVLKIKVAKGAAGQLEALSGEQLEMLQAYCNRVRPLGVRVKVMSGAANEVSLGGVVRYGAELNVGDVRRRVQEAVAEVLRDLKFGGVLYEGRIAAAMMAVEGVEDVKLGGLTIDGVAWSDKTEPRSGYCVPGVDRLEYEGI